MGQNLEAASDITSPSEEPNIVGDRIEAGPSTMPLRWIRFATAGVGLVWTYFLLVFFYGETVFGVHVQFRYLVLIVVTSFGGLYWFGRWSYRRQLVSMTRLKDLTAASIALLLFMLAADIGYSFYFNAKNYGSNSIDQDWQAKISYERLGDPQFWIAEEYPKLYYPTEKNFVLYKPKASISIETFGGLYYPSLMKSPTVANSVLELRHISYSIDEHGFRETTPLEQAHIFALGDSFTFGWSVSQDKVWVERWEQAIGEPVYNLGISNTSPKQQLMLLEYMLQTNPDFIRGGHLFWMIYEGNDLEDSYETFRPTIEQEEVTLETLSRGTIVGMFNAIPSLIKEQSIINRLRTGQISLALPASDTNQTDPYLADGIKLLYPRYHSNKYGYSLFFAEEIELARQPQSYLVNHPNRQSLDQTFKDMASLSRKYGVTVTVVIAPTASRLYGPYFENLSSILEKPYFINYVENLSNDLEFDVINLYLLMQPYAEEELLYWRDDGHWNERGNEVVAEIMTKQWADRLVFLGNFVEAK